MADTAPKELWGSETVKAVANFPVSGEPIPAPVVHWLGRIKAAAARVNAELGLLDADLAERGVVDGRRDDVVRRLPEVHVVVRVDAVARERGHDLVRVHVRARARAGLVDVDGELVVPVAASDLGGRVGNGLGLH